MAKKTEAKPWTDSYGDEDDYYATKGGCIVPILIAMLIGLGSCMM
jgi:hypothetical protein